MKETELAKYFIKSFDDSGYEIFQEVKILKNGLTESITDIALKYNSFIWAVECKVSFCVTVMAQAFENLKYYNYSSICTPYPRSKKLWMFGKKICKDNGIGVFIISKDGDITEHLKAKLQRKARTDFVRLFDGQKNIKNAGTKNGERWTPFNQTVSELEKYIKKNPGCKLREALKHISHHYASLSSAQQSIRQWIKSGVIDTISLNNGYLTLKTDKK